MVNHSAACDVTVAFLFVLFLLPARGLWLTISLRCVLIMRVVFRIAPPTARRVRTQRKGFDHQPSGGALNQGSGGRATRSRELRAGVVVFGRNSRT